jgi:hypothetical protein
MYVLLTFILGLALPVLFQLYLVASRTTLRGFQNRYLEFGFILGGHYTALNLLASWFQLYGFSLSKSFTYSLLILSLVYLLLFFFARVEESIDGRSKLGTFPVILVSLAGMFGLVRILLILKYGDHSWDANAQHIPMALSILQGNGSLEELRYLTEYQLSPSLAQNFGSWIGLNTNSVSAISTMQTPWILATVSFWLGLILKFTTENKRNRTVLVSILVINPPLLLSFGLGYVDFVSAWGLTLMCTIIIRDYKFEKFSSLALFVFGILGTMTGKFTVWIAGVFLASVFLATVLFLNSKREFLQTTLTASLAIIFGSVYLVRAQTLEKNPFYPGTNYLTNKNNGPLSYSEVKSRLNASSLPDIQNVNQLSAFVWNTLLSIEKWIQIHVNFSTDLFYQVYAHDARVVGNGIGITVLLFFIVFNSKFWNEILRERVNRFYFGVLVIGGLCIPQPANMRYLWGLIVPLAILGGSRLDYTKIFQKIISVILFISIIGMGFQLKSEFNQDKYNSEFNNELSLGAYFFIQNPTFLFSVKENCNTVALIGDPPSFSSVLWLNKTCTQVKSYSDLESFLNSTEASKITVLAIQKNADPKCETSYKSTEGTTILARWGDSRSTIYFMDPDKIMLIEDQCIVERLPS